MRAARLRHDIRFRRVCHLHARARKREWLHREDNAAKTRYHLTFVTRRDVELCLKLRIDLMLTNLILMAFSAFPLVIRAREAIIGDDAEDRRGAARRKEKRVNHAVHLIAW